MRRVLQIVLPFAFVLGGLAIFLGLRALTAPAERSNTGPAPTQVEVAVMAAGEHRAVLHASGSVEPAQRVDLVAQVPGRVVRVASGLTPGLRLDKGDLIAAIDDRDYRANVVQARAAVEAAQLDLQLEENRGAQAAREFELLGATPKGPLASREAQLGLARTRVESAEAGLTTAELALERTRLVSPFNGYVAAESLDVGQYVAPGAPVATLVGTDRFRVRVSLPARQIPLLQIPELGDAEGSPAVVRQRLGDGRVIEAEGYVLRMLGQLDEQTRTAAVLVAIDDPWDVPTGTLPILPGAYVDVEILGRTMPGLHEVPRVALADGDQVWIADPEDRLASRTVEVAFGTPDHVYVRSGLQDGDRVVVTPLSLPVTGLPLQVQDTVAEAN